MFDLTQNLVITVLWIVFGVVKIWAFVDCVRRPAQAFPDEEEAINNASLAEIQLAVEKHYDGGIDAFIRASLGHNYSGWTWQILNRVKTQ